MRIKLKISRNSLSSFSQEELQEVQKQLLLEFLERLHNDNGIIFGWVLIKCCYGRFNQLWISDKAQE
jgi:hypothetical protein